jgi:hypothetical protein
VQLNVTNPDVDRGTKFAAEFRAYPVLYDGNAPDPPVDTTKTTKRVITCEKDQAFCNPLYMLHFDFVRYSNYTVFVQAVNVSESSPLRESYLWVRPDWGTCANSENACGRLVCVRRRRLHAVRVVVSVHVPAADVCGDCGVCAQTTSVSVVGLAGRAEVDGVHSFRADGRRQSLLRARAHRRALVPGVLRSGTTTRTCARVCVCVCAFTR